MRTGPYFWPFILLLVCIVISTVYIYLVSLYMINPGYGFQSPIIRIKRDDPTKSSGMNNMRSIFRNRRSNSESGESGRPPTSSPSARPGPNDAGPSRPPPIREVSEERTSPVAIPVREVLPPGYSPGSAAAPIPSYEVALGASTQSPRALSGFLGSPSRRRSALGSSFGGRGSALDDEEDTDEDDPLVPRIIRPSPALLLVPLPTRRATFAAPPRPPSPSPDQQILLQLPVEVPRPPANALPAYSPHLLRDELRLISAVHLDQTHPAAAFFNHIATSYNASGGTQRDQTEEMTTGSKKLKLTMTRGAERMNSNGTGPIFIRLPRGGDLAGRIEVGKADHATQLEVSIIGLVNTSYYIRGQYTLIDTLPLCRRHQVLYPLSGSTEAEDATTEEPIVSVSADGVEADPVPTPSRSNAASGSGSTAQAQAGPSSEPSTAPDPSQSSSKDVAFIAPGQKFEFALKMPSVHFRDSQVELPPTSSIFQVGMQASVEYVLRIKLSRKGWRLNETITVPIIYEPRSYVNPRRLRALTTDDAMNPGWRTIKLHGGDPAKPETTTTPQQGVNATLLLPSPPIVYIPWGAEPPPIPFHIHFHSSLTHALATFSDPTQSNFVIRLMRVATMRIGAEREVRRMEVPAKVEIWQEGGPRIVLGEQPKLTVASLVSSVVGGGSSPSTTTPGSARRPSIGGTERRQSFFRRLSLDRTQSREADPLQRQQSNVPPAVPPVQEEPEHTAQTDEVTTEPSESSHEARIGSSSNGHEEPLSAPPIAPLALSSTDVHFLGELTITFPSSGPELLRRLVQSFMTPEIGITYVLEVGIQPNSGSVKEAFKHVWGGGLVEIVLGSRPLDAEEAGVNLRPADARS